MSFINFGPRSLLAGGFKYQRPVGGVAVSYKVLSGKISAANIIGTGAGQFSHANGVIMVPAAPTGVVNKFDFCVVTMDFVTAAYTGGGNVTVNIGGGGAALTGLVATANFIQAAADKTIEFVPLAATFNTYTTANSLNLVSSVATTNPGTAAGTINWVCGFYQIGPVIY